MVDNNHYKKSQIEPLAVIESYGLGFCLGNVIKYVLRHPHKGGVDDLHKAVWYLAYNITNSVAKADEVLAVLDAVTPPAVAPPADATSAPKQMAKVVTIGESLTTLAKAFGADADPKNRVTTTQQIVAAWQPIQIQMEREK